MRSEAVIREEPGEYRIVARYGDGGEFAVHGESSHPITLTVRVEDVWERIPDGKRRHSYGAAVRKDGSDSVTELRDVAPDARIFIEFEKVFDISFS